MVKAAGKIITKKDVENVIAGYPLQEQKKMQNTTVKQRILDQLVATRLFSVRAREEGLDNTENFKKIIDNLADEVLSQMVVTNMVKNIVVTQEEEMEYYNRNKEQYASGQQVLAKHILVPTKEQADKIKSEIDNKDVTFEIAAGKYSTCPSKDRGGDLGCFSRGQMVPEFEQAAFAADIDSVTDPVQTQFGYHLILVKDKKEPHTIDFSEVRESIHSEIIKEKQKKVYNDELEKMIHKYGVERIENFK